MKRDREVHVQNLLDRLDVLRKWLALRNAVVGTVDVRNALDEALREFDRGEFMAGERAS